MQRNAGDFVRDCVSSPCVPEDGAGCLPRFLDLPVLLAALALTLVVLPFIFCVCFLVPFVISVELFFGSAMRASFCAHVSNDSDWHQIFWRRTAIMVKWSPYVDILTVLGGAVVAFFLVFILRKVLPPCRLQPPREDLGRRPGRWRATRCYLFGYAAESFSRRFIIGVVIVALLPYYAAITNNMAYSPATTASFCQKYMKRMQSKQMIHNGCAEFYSDGLAPWWKDPYFAGNRTARSGHGGREASQILAQKLRAEAHHFHATVMLIQAFVAMALIGILIVPICGPEFLKRLIFIAGPVLVFVMTVEFMQFRVFGPVTRNWAGTWYWTSVEQWDYLIHYALLACILTLPFLAELRSTFHVYYRRSLQQNYFDEGKDLPMQDLAKAPYCPFIVLTGTACDYKPPGETDTISEVSFSALHCGGEETGYVRTPFFRSLGTCTALTGAGCMDAISLTMSDLMTLRFWLEVFNLTWGDYIFFHPEGSSWLGRLKCLGRTMEHTVAPKLHRAPGVLPIVTVYVLFSVAWHRMRDPDVDCHQVRLLFRAAIYLAVAIIGFSFFTFLPGCAAVSMSPLIRRIHQLSMYFYKGNHPPHMLYVTDGGVKDCTSIIQLLVRRRERILLVLAAADPRDELGVLQAAMQVARSLKISSFYDPEDPRRDLELLFSKYQEDKDMAYLHLGISYCWAPTEDGGARTGHLIVVKNRLPTRCWKQPVEPLLMEEEISGKAGRERDDAFSRRWEGITTDGLGPFGCCDCCHTLGLNCGPKFPHGTFTGYLYLSPEWCSSLMRLGYEVSRDAVANITTPLLPAAGWEAHVRPARHGAGI